MWGVVCCALWAYGLFLSASPSLERIGWPSIVGGEGGGLFLILMGSLLACCAYGVRLLVSRHGWRRLHERMGALSTRHAHARAVPFLEERLRLLDDVACLASVSRHESARRAILSLLCRYIGENAQKTAQSHPDHVEKRASCAPVGADIHRAFVLLKALFSRWCCRTETFSGTFSGLSHAMAMPRLAREVCFLHADFRVLDMTSIPWVDAPRLRSARLQGATLSHAHLSSANLQGAHLQGACLSYANLQAANLAGADLRGANLQGATLQAANLQGANLQGANIEGTNLDYSLWYGARLAITPDDVASWHSELTAMGLAESLCRQIIDDASQRCHIAQKRNAWLPHALYRDIPLFFQRKGDDAFAKERKKKRRGRLRYPLSHLIPLDVTEELAHWRERWQQFFHTACVSPASALMMLVFHDHAHRGTPCVHALWQTMCEMADGKVIEKHVSPEMLSRLNP